MGQKVNPIGLRLGVNRTWDSRWYARDGEYSTMLHEDLRIRKFLRERLSQAGVSKIVIERPAKKARATSVSSRRFTNPCAGENRLLWGRSIPSRGPTGCRRFRVLRAGRQSSSRSSARTTSRAIVLEILAA